MVYKMRYRSQHPYSIKEKQMKSEVLSVKEKIGYGMGDAASHIIFDNVMLYMMFFYTDIFGIPAGFVGTMFLVARALDAISDPCMGLLADRTRSRWGKFRPWVLFGALPFGIVCVLAYSTPDLSMNGKMIYAAITYTLLTLLYTIVNIPYCALGGVITNDPTQRISLQSWRFVLATAGGMLSTVLMMPLVNLIGGDNKPLGFQGGIAVLSVVAFMMLAFCFFTTKERVDCFKTDFGERIPTDVQWFDGSEPQKMHNHYAYIYNELVWNVLKDTVGEEEAVLFARSASVGAQKFPVHWGGDCYANYESMAESLRGGLSIGLSGFGFWSHDIGGFENTAPAHVYKRWCAFGLLSSHSRLHGSKSYRVPWAYDDESCDVVRFFTQLKCRMMPYLYREAARANARGTPMMRAMMMEFPDDPACDYLDRQYMLGDNVMVAPVFTEAGDVQFYLPEGRWTHLWHNDELDGSRWHKQQHSFLSLPVYVRDSTLLALGNNDQRPDYAWHEGTAFHLFNLQDGHEAVCEVPDADGSVIFTLKAARTGNTITVTGTGEAKNWTLCLRNIVKVNGLQGGSQAESEQGLVVTPQGNALTITL
ncbi:alpha-xylosidase [Escherichia coli]